MPVVLAAAPARPRASIECLDAPDRYFNRELSWLEFNQRVLDEALDADVPLLERLKFLAITGSNLDEFFMVRVGGLQTAGGRAAAAARSAGLTPAQQLDRDRARARRMVGTTSTPAIRTQLEPALARAGHPARSVRRAAPARAGAVRRAAVRGGDLPASLTPMARRPRRRVPAAGRTSRCTCVRPPAHPEEGGGREAFGVVAIPRGLPPLRTPCPAAARLRATCSSRTWSPLFVDRLFPGRARRGDRAPFRITRNADLSVREDLAADLLAEMEEVLDRAQAERLRAAGDRPHRSPRTCARCSRRGSGVRTSDVYAVPGPLDLSGFLGFAAVPGFDELKLRALDPRSRRPTSTAGGAHVRRSSRGATSCSSHPYESFDPVVRFVEEAADDPDVLAIKQILYRTSRQQPDRRRPARGRASAAST